jgi:hypothetical protein
MKMNKTNLLRILIPLVAVLVIAESIYLVASLVNKNKVAVEQVNSPVSENQMNISLVSEAEKYVVGEPFLVKVVMDAQKDVLVDAVNLYVQYDPGQATVSELTSLEALPQPTFAKISDKKDMIVLNYYIENDGYAFLAQQPIEVASFMVTPTRLGEIKMDLSTGIEDKDSVTMIVENGTSLVVPFISNSLSIEVLE